MPVIFTHARHACAEKCNIDGVFSIASRKERATVCFPSGSKVFTKELSGNSSRNGCGRAVSVRVRGSVVTMAEDSQQEKPLMKER